MPHTRARQYPPAASADGEADVRAPPRLDDGTESVSAGRLHGPCPCVNVRPNARLASTRSRPLTFLTGVATPGRLLGRALTCAAGRPLLHTRWAARPRGARAVLRTLLSVSMARASYGRRGTSHLGRASSAGGMSVAGIGRLGSFLPGKSSARPCGPPAASYLLLPRVGSPPETARGPPRPPATQQGWHRRCPGRCRRKER